MKNLSIFSKLANQTRNYCVYLFVSITTSFFFDRHIMLMLITVLKVFVMMIVMEIHTADCTKPKSCLCRNIIPHYTQGNVLQI